MCRVFYVLVFCFRVGGITEPNLRSAEDELEEHAHRNLIHRHHRRRTLHPIGVDRLPEQSGRRVQRAVNCPRRRGAACRGCGELPVGLIPKEKGEGRGTRLASFEDSRRREIIRTTRQGGIQRVTGNGVCVLLVLVLGCLCFRVLVCCVLWFREFRVVGF